MQTAFSYKSNDRMYIGKKKKYNMTSYYKITNKLSLDNINKCNIKIEMDNFT